jgi:CheY-like chemotaxis protein
LCALRRYTRRKYAHKVLLVDDNEVSRYLLRENLPSSQLEIIEAHNGREGLRIAMRLSPDLIFLDLLMPEMSGFDFLRELRQHDETRSIPVIVCTSKSLDDDEVEELLESATAIIPKSDLDAGTTDRLYQAISKAGVQFETGTYSS